MLKFSGIEEPRWPAVLAIGFVLLLYLRLPERVTLGPQWVFPVIAVIILVAVLVVRARAREQTPLQRGMSIGMAVVLNAFNIATIVLLAMWEFSEHHKRPIGGEALLKTAVNIWLTNLIVYALWFWEIDGGGPDARTHTPVTQEIERSDFLFPQMTLELQTRERMQWKPRFADYLFLAFTNAAAFSPADTFPLSRRGKMLMMAEAVLSLVTLAIFAARAIGMIGGS